MSKDQCIVEVTPPKFHQVVLFQDVREGLPHNCFYEVLTFRAPAKGEWFLSGDTMELAERAGWDFPETAEYWIVRPVNYAVSRWYKGERV